MTPINHLKIFFAFHFDLAIAKQKNTLKSHEINLFHFSILCQILNEYSIYVLFWELFTLI